MSKHFTPRNKIVVAMILIVVALASTIMITVATSDHSLNEIERSIQSHFESIDTTDLNCYGMSEAVKEHVEEMYDYPVIYVHGEMTKKLKSLKHTWLMIKIGGNWHEFESVALEFRDVSNCFELEFMTYDYHEKI